MRAEQFRSPPANDHEMLPPNRRRLLLVEDDRDTAAAILNLASVSGIAQCWRCEVAPSVPEALEAIGHKHFDAIASKPSIGEHDGRDFVRLARTLSNAALVLYDVGQNFGQDRRAAMLLEGVDVMHDPLLAPAEFFARVEAAARRGSARVGVIKIGHLEVHPQSQTFRVCGLPLQLTPQERPLLLLLVLSHPRLVGYPEFANAAGYNKHFSRRALLEALRRLRRKLAEASIFLEIVTAVGARLAQRHPLVE